MDTCPQPPALRALWPALCALVFLVCSCSRHQPTTADLQGNWLPDTNSQHWIKGASNHSPCQIVLREDGTFTATVPDYMMDTFNNCSGQTKTGKGKWAYTAKGFQLDEVGFAFSEVDGRQINWGSKPLRVDWNGSGFDLYFYVQEEGEDRFTFKRVTGQNPSRDAAK